VEPGDAYTIVYTSGTTGPPKGVVLTHRNAMSVCEIVEEVNIIEPQEVSYLFLPLAHVFALTVMLASFDQGTSIVYFGGDTKQILAELIETQPSYLPSVPRIFEKLYTAAMKLQEQGGQEDRERFAQAIKLGVEVRQRQQRGDEVPAEMQEAFDQAEERLYGRVRGLFGGHIHQAVTGAAPIAPEILEFFHAAGVPVHEGWGLSESAGVGTFNTSGATRIGTIGLPVPGSEIRFADDGEILMRGPQVFAGYWNNPDATAEMLIDGWLQSGDLGSADDDGFVTITGRKKDIIITAGGKNLTPANLENELRQSQWISQAVMHGDRRPYPVVLITLDAEQVAPWARQQGLPDDMAQLAVHPAVRALIEPVVAEVNARRAQVAQVKKFVILDHDLSQETGELTPTLKVKRRVVEVKYAQLFDALYGGPA
jgi:long-chain acyl-CoA synthetase